MPMVPSTVSCTANCSSPDHGERRHGSLDDVSVPTRSSGDSDITSYRVEITTVSDDRSDPTCMPQIDRGQSLVPPARRCDLVAFPSSIDTACRSPSNVASMPPAARC